MDVSSRERMRADWLNIAHEDWRMFIISGTVSKLWPQSTTRSGAAMLAFEVLSATGRLDEDGRPMREKWNVKTFGAVAESCIDSLTEGCPVFVQGRPYLREFIRRDGTKAQAVDLIADHVSLRLTSHRVAKVSVELAGRVNEMPDVL